MTRSLTVKVRSAEDLHSARFEILTFALALPFAADDRGRLDLAVMELGSNLVKHGGGGTFTVALLSARPGLSIVCEDEGPGIADLRQAVMPGFSTTGSFGDGLASVKEVMDVFLLSSEVGRGTRVEVEKWLA